MTYESQEEHDHFECGEATMLGELGSVPKEETKKLVFESREEAERHYEKYIKVWKIEDSYSKDKIYKDFTQWLLEEKIIIKSEQNKDPRIVDLGSEYNKYGLDGGLLTNIKI